MLNKLAICFGLYFLHIVNSVILCICVLPLEKSSISQSKEHFIYQDIAPQRCFCKKVSGMETIAVKLSLSFLLKKLSNRLTNDLINSYLIGSMSSYLIDYGIKSMDDLIPYDGGLYDFDMDLTSLIHPGFLTQFGWYTIH